MAGMCRHGLLQTDPQIPWAVPVLSSQGVPAPLPSLPLAFLAMGTSHLCEDRPSFSLAFISERCSLELCMSVPDKLLCLSLLCNCKEFSLLLPTFPERRAFGM